MLVRFFVIFLLIPQLVLAMKPEPWVHSLVIDELHVQNTTDEHEKSGKIDAEYWYGKNLSKLWLTFEGEGNSGRFEHAEAKVFFSHAVSSYWDYLLGLQIENAEEKPLEKDQEVSFIIGAKGMAWGFVDHDVLIYWDGDNQPLLEWELEREWMITQRIELITEGALLMSADTNSEKLQGKGLSSLEAGIKLVYKVTRDVGLYLGFERELDFAETRDLKRSASEAYDESLYLLGLKAGF